MLTVALHAHPSLPLPLDKIYAATLVDKSLVRTVEMGPFKHIVDDGAPCRASAYTLLSLLAPTPDVVSAVMRGLSDPDSGITLLTHSLLLKLASTHPDLVKYRLSDAVEGLTKSLGIVVKESAVKQEREGRDEIVASAGRVVRALRGLDPAFMADVVLEAEKN